MRILIAEDLEDIREGIAEMLRRIGHTVVEAADGEEAWRLFRTEPFDFVVTNWMMDRERPYWIIDPERPHQIIHPYSPKNGDTLARRIREWGSTVPIAVYSGAPDSAKAFADIDGAFVTDSPFEIVKLLTGRDPRSPAMPKVDL